MQPKIKIEINSSSFFLICKHKVKQGCGNSPILINSLWTEVDLPLSLCFPTR